MRGQDVEHPLTVADAASRRDAVAEHHLLAVVMQGRREAEAAALARLLDAPAGEGARHLGDVVLRVAAVDAERVQFQQFAPVVLVQPGRTSRHRSRRVEVRPVRVGTHPVVQIEEHGGAFRRGAEQLAEVPEDVRADRLAFILGQQKPCRALLRVDVEVVEPEVGQHFVQLPLAVDGPNDLRVGQFDERQVGAHPLGAIRRWRRSAGIGRCIAALRLAGATRLECGNRKLLGDVARRQLQGLEPVESPLQTPVFERVRMELLLDEALDAHALHPFDVAGAGTIRDAVQYVQRRAGVGGR